MNKIYIKLILAGLFNIFLLNYTIAQKNALVLSDNSQTLKDVVNVACKSIAMKPGYVYQPATGKSMRAYIDPNIICDVDYVNDGTGNSTVSAWSSSNAVGTTPGNFDVSPSGGAIYNIPLMVPPGTAGMQPGLSFTYNSQGGSGMLGMGWTLAGFSAITRTGQTIYHDGKTAGIGLGSDDRFLMDGNRLILVGGTNGVASSTYATESETFSTIIYKTAGSYQYFEVVTKDGTTMEYGNTTDSRFIAKGTSVSVHTWLLHKVKDARGNYMEIQYHNDQNSGEYRPEKILYTKNDGSTIPDYANEVRFFYSKKTDKQTAYVANTYQRSTVLLTRVEMYAERSLAHSYELKYSAEDLHSNLREVVEYDASGNKYNSIKIEWESVGLTGAFAPKFAGNLKGKLISGDYNGDGITDLVAITPTGLLETWINNGDATFSKKDSRDVPQKDSLDVSSTWNLYYYATRLPNYTIDFNGDGLSDLLMPSEINQNYTEREANFYILNATKGTVGFEAPRLLSFIPPGLIDGRYRECVGDFDGDGKTDIFVLFYLSNKYAVYLSSIDQIKYHSYSYAVYQFASPQPIDYDGDGKHEMLFHDKVNGYSKVMNVASDGQISELMSDGYPAQERVIQTGDFNGDGLTDVFTRPTAYDNPAIAIGLGVQGTKFITTPFSPTQLDILGRVGVGNNNEHLIGDFNGDGIDDLIDKWYNINTNTQFKILFSNGDKFIDKYYVTGLALNTQGSSSIGDFDGDGVNDILYQDGNALGTMYFCKFNNGPDGRVKEIRNGFDSPTEIKYNTLSRMAGLSVPGYSKGNSSSYPVMDYQGPISVVEQVKKDNGVGGQTIIDYSYAGLKIHRQGKGMLGFDSFETYNEINSVKSTTTFGLNTTYYTRFITSATTNINTNIISEETYTSTFTPKHSGKGFFMYNSGIVSFDGLRYVTTTTTSSYDESTGNLKSQNTANSDLSSRVSYDYDDANCPTCLTKSTTTTTRGSNADYVRHVSYLNYNKDTRLPKFVSTDEGLTTEYTYNATGLVDIEKATADGKTREVHYSYDAKFRFKTKTEKVHNGTNIVVGTASYEPVYGNVLERYDINNLKTIYKYDGFGRIIEITTPTGHMTTIQRSWTQNIPAGSSFSITTSPQENSPSIEYFDIFGRNVATSTKSFDNQNVLTTSEYNALGQLAKSTIPHFSANTNTTAITSNYSYLPDGRIATELRPNGATVSYSYETPGNISRSKTITWIVNGQNKSRTYTTLYDEAGLVTTATDNLGKSVNYAYNSAGKPVTISSLGSTTTSSYNTYGRQTHLVDPDAGTMQYTYNPFGELISQTDARANTTTMDYDDWGRVNTKVGAEGTTSYTYDTKTNGKGLVAVVTGFNGLTQEYDYDQYSRVKSLKETVDENDPGQILTTGYDYDIQNRLTEMTYPSGFAVGQQYNTQGYLEKVYSKSDNKTLWQCNSLNAFNQVLSSSIGSKIDETKTYAALGILQTHDISKTSAVAWSRAYGYSFDAVTGNLDNRSDNSRNLTETFTYDELDRLTGINFNGQQKTITYADNGNIMSKYDAGSGYVYDSPKPHAVTKIGTPISTFTNTTQDISYTPFNKAEVLGEGAAGADPFETTIAYGPDLERRKSYFEVSGGTGAPPVPVTKYYSGSCEKVINTSTSTTRFIDYIVGGDGLCAIHVKNNTTDSIYFVMTDHLGSITLITDENGNILDERSFDAWGRIRNCTDWTYNNVNALGITDRGYTGHEHLVQYGLINMNGRMYDPLVGRMLSPDIYVQDFTNTQCYNRYSYCLNNPLKYTDPSGNLVWIIPFISYSNGNLDISITVGVGIPGIASAQATIGYNTSGNLYFVGSTSLGGLTGYAGIGTKSGPFGGLTFGMPISNRSGQAPTNTNQPAKGQVNEPIQQPDPVYFADAGGNTGMCDGGDCPLTTPTVTPTVTAELSAVEKVEPKRNDWQAVDNFIADIYNGRFLNAFNTFVNFTVSSGPAGIASFPIVGGAGAFARGGMQVLTKAEMAAIKGAGSNFKILSNGTLKAAGIDAHTLKMEFLGNKAPIAQWDLYKETITNEILILRKGGVGDPIRTGIIIR